MLPLNSPAFTVHIGQPWSGAVAASAGDRVVRSTLRHVRSVAQYSRLNGGGVEGFVEGLAIGAIGVAELYLDADPFLVTAARNEVRFLAARSTEINALGREMAA